MMLATEAMPGIAASRPSMTLRIVGTVDNRRSTRSTRNARNAENAWLAGISAISTTVASNRLQGWVKKRSR